MTVAFRLLDRQRRLARVRLAQEVGLAETELIRVAGEWRLEAEQPPVDRMEYLFEVEDHNGHRWTITDPSNPLRAPGAFGEKSVVEFEGYVAPAWLDAEVPDGRRTGIAGDVDLTLWSPEGLDADEPAPLVLVHDGPEYDALGGFTRYLATLGRPVRAALLDPGDRNDWYSANPDYAGNLAAAVTDLVAGLAPTTVRIGVGVSLGALAMLHAHRTRPGLVDALFLQSGSFFTAELDPQEHRFAHFAAVTEFVRGVHDSADDPHPVPTTLTCGTVEENLLNNELMTTTLESLGYAAALHPCRDAHNYTAWRDALHPHLTELIARAT